jgi:hypothetical protein
LIAHARLFGPFSYGDSGDDVDGQSYLVCMRVDHRSLGVRGCGSSLVREGKVQRDGYNHQ